MLGGSTAARCKKFLMVLLVLCVSVFLLATHSWGILDGDEKYGEAVADRRDDSRIVFDIGKTRLSIPTEYFYIKPRLDREPGNTHYFGFGISVLMPDMSPIAKNGYVSGRGDIDIVDIFADYSDDRAPLAEGIGFLYSLQGNSHSDSSIVGFKSFGDGGQFIFSGDISNPDFFMICTPANEAPYPRCVSKAEVINNIFIDVSFSRKHISNSTLISRKAIEVLNSFRVDGPDLQPIK